MLIGLLPLIASCGPQSQQELVKLTGPTSVAASTCATFQLGSDDYVRDIWIGEPILTADGATVCPRDHRVDHEALSYRNLLENGLCELTKLADTSEARCVLRVTRRSVEVPNSVD